MFCFHEEEEAEVMVELDDRKKGKLVVGFQGKDYRCFD